MEHSAFQAATCLDSGSSAPFALPIPLPPPSPPPLTSSNSNESSGTTTAATSRGPLLGIVAVTAAGGSTRLWQRPVSLQEGWVQLRVEVPLQQEQEEGEPEDGQALLLAPDAASPDLGAGGSDSSSFSSSPSRSCLPRFLLTAARHALPAPTCSAQAPAAPSSTRRPAPTRPTAATVLAGLCVLQSAALLALLCSWRRQSPRQKQPAAAAADVPAGSTPTRDRAPAPRLGQCDAGTSPLALLLSPFAAGSIRRQLLLSGLEMPHGEGHEGAPAPAAEVERQAQRKGNPAGLGLSEKQPPPGWTRWVEQGVWVCAGGVRFSPPAADSKQDMHPLLFSSPPSCPPSPLCAGMPGAGCSGRLARAGAAARAWHHRLLAQSSRLPLVMATAAEAWFGGSPHKTPCLPSPQTRYVQPRYYLCDQRSGMIHIGLRD